MKVKYVQSLMTTHVAQHTYDTEVNMNPGKVVKADLRKKWAIFHRSSSLPRFELRTLLVLVNNCKLDSESSSGIEPQNT